MSTTATIRASDLPLVLAAAKLRRYTHGRTCQLCALSSAPLITVDCHENAWLRKHAQDDARRMGISPARVLPMQRGHIARLAERVQRTHGRREVLKTWGAGIRALLAEPMYTLNGDAQ
jgi:hypothetical protein